MLGLNFNAFTVQGGLIVERGISQLILEEGWRRGSEGGGGGKNSSKSLSTLTYRYTQYVRSAPAYWQNPI